MVKVCPGCRATFMGGLHCQRCGEKLTDVGDRTKREDVVGLGISIRALYAARAAMVLSCAGFLFGAMFGLMFVRRAFGPDVPVGRWFWYLLGAVIFLAVWRGLTRLGKFHYDRTLAMNRENTGRTGAEADFFDGEFDHST